MKQNSFYQTSWLGGKDIVSFFDKLYKENTRLDPAIMSLFGMITRSFKSLRQRVKFELSSFAKQVYRPMSSLFRAFRIVLSSPAS